MLNVQIYPESLHQLSCLLFIKKPVVTDQDTEAPVSISCSLQKN